MRSAVRKMGNSSGVIIPKPFLTKIGAEVGDDVEMRVEDGRLVIAPIKRPPRDGWREDAKRIAEAGDDALTWPEFGNEDDDALIW
jgi:antitoxin MazE